MDQYEACFKRLLEFALLQNLIERFQSYEESMFLQSSKTFKL